MTGSVNIQQRNTGKKLLTQWIKLISAITFYGDGCKHVGKVTGMLIRKKMYYYICGMMSSY